MRHLFVLVVAALPVAAFACSSSSSGSSSSKDAGAEGGGGGGGGGGDGGAASDSGSIANGSCTVTFGDGASSVVSSECSPLTQLPGDAFVGYEFTGTASGLKGTTTYNFGVKVPPPAAVKTYHLTDLYQIDDLISVAANSNVFEVSYDSTDTSSQAGDATFTLTDLDHGTLDLSMVDTNHGTTATVHIEF